MLSNQSLHQEADNVEQRVFTRDLKKHVNIVEVESIKQCAIIGKIFIRKKRLNGRNTVWSFLKESFGE